MLDDNVIVRNNPGIDATGTGTSVAYTLGNNTAAQNVPNNVSGSVTLSFYGGI